MSLLIDCAPTHVMINGSRCAINSDYRTSLLFEMLIGDDDIPENAKIFAALALYYPEIPQNTSEAIKQMLWFYRCGKDYVQAKQGKAQSERLYDYEIDDNYILAAFLSDYNLDLEQTQYLHWWKFKAYFDALRPDNTFCKIMEYRSIDLTKFKGEQRKYYAKLKKLYELPKPQSEKEKDDAIADILMNDGNISSFLEK